MSWNSFFDDLCSGELGGVDDSLTARHVRNEIARVRERMRESGRDAADVRADLREEIEVLHVNFARTLLLLHGLTTTLLRKQLITPQELQTVIQELDLRDGYPDQALAPDAVPGLQPRPAERRSHLTHLDDLARGPADDTPTPRDFLKEMEGRESPGR